MENNNLDVIESVEVETKLEKTKRIASKVVMAAGIAMVGLVVYGLVSGDGYTEEMIEEGKLEDSIDYSKE